MHLKIYFDDLTDPSAARDALWSKGYNNTEIRSATHDKSLLGMEHLEIGVHYADDMIAALTIIRPYIKE